MNKYNIKIIFIKKSNAHAPLRTKYDFQSFLSELREHYVDWAVLFFAGSCFFDVFPSIAKPAILLVLKFFLNNLFG